MMQKFPDRTRSVFKFASKKRIAMNWELTYPKTYALLKQCRGEHVNIVEKHLRDRKSHKWKSALLSIQDVRHTLLLVIVTKHYRKYNLLSCCFGRNWEKVKMHKRGIRCKSWDHLCQASLSYHHCRCWEKYLKFLLNMMRIRQRRKENIPKN